MWISHRKKRKELHKMKLIHHFLGILCAFALMVSLLITSVEAVTYWTPDYYEKEYMKYHVLENVHMEMDDLLDVTEEMMAYLKGKRPDLHVPAIVDGQPREFFNQREIAHMEDVRGLFLAAIAIRRVCLFTILAAIGLLILTRADIRRVLPRTICVGTVLFFALLAALATIISTDFTKYFIVFHKIFFHNDLWMLDPSTDLLINIVPEPFFMDTAARIGITYGICVSAVFLLCLAAILLSGKGKSRSGPTRKRHVSFLLCLFLFTGMFHQDAAAAPPWPEGPSISAEGGILFDANSGAVLYGKNIHEQYYPASITKILTALIIIENCQMDEVVAFSHNAVYNVESGSSNANMEEGDRMTVRDCLYAMMLKSANEVANALAEHTASTTEAFATMMNAKAISLGCTDSHFNNPSGLNDPEHYTSAHDMALIAQAAFQNETFAQIASTLYYDLPPTKRNPEGLRIYPGHQMIKKNSPNYYPGAIGGKTGYTSLAGNTLVTCARRDNMMLITVVLNGHRTHYTDTRALLNFGFRNFRSLDISELDDTYTSIENDLTIAELPTTDLSVITVQKDCRLSLPLNGEFSDTTSSISYDLPPGAPEHAAALISYDYDGRTVGSAYLMVNKNMPEPSADYLTVQSLDVPAETDAEQIANALDPFYQDVGSHGPGPGSESESPRGFSVRIPVFVWILLSIAALFAIAYGIMFLMQLRRKRESAERRLRYQRRRQRLQDIGMSGDEFKLLVEQKRKKSLLGSQKRRYPRKRKT